MIYMFFLPFLLQILWNLIHGFGIGKEVTTYFPVFPVRVLGLFEVLERKKFVFATPPKPFMEFLEFK